MGVELHKKPKDLIASEREERGHGKGVGVYATLLQSDTVQPYGRAKAGTRPVGVEMRKKPKEGGGGAKEVSCWEKNKWPLGILPSGRPLRAGARNGG